MRLAVLDEELMERAAGHDQVRAAPVASWPNSMSDPYILSGALAASDHRDRAPAGSAANHRSTLVISLTRP